MANITTVLNRIQQISDKLFQQQVLTKKDLGFIEDNLNKSIKELQADLDWLYEVKDKVSDNYSVKLKD